MAGSAARSPSQSRRAFKGARTTDTLNRIVDSTRHLLARRGFESLSMRAVASRSGITVGAIYRHFPSKEALVDHVIADTFEEFELKLLQAIAPLPVGSFERIAVLGSTYIEMALEHTEQFKVLFTPTRTARKLAELPGRGGFDVLRQCVVEAMESHTLRRADPDLVAFFLWSRVHGIVTLMWACDFRGTLRLPPEDLTPTALFEATREFIAFGLGSGVKS